MSNAIGASSSNALSYLQSLLQHGTAGAKDAKGAKAASASDPMSMFMQTISGGDESSGQTAPAAPLPKSTSNAIRTPFSTDTMSALISAQAQQSDVAAKAQLRMLNAASSTMAAFA